MSEEMSKALLLNKIEEGFARWQDFINSLDPSTLTEREGEDGWSIKDHIAHVNSWHRQMIDRLQKGLEGQPLAELGTPDITLDERNARFYEENRDLSLAEVLEQNDATYHQALELVEQVPEELLLDPKLLEAIDGAILWQEISWDTYNHYTEHIEYIQANLTQKAS